MKVNDIITEGPISNISNALHARKQSKKAKQIAKSIEKKAPALAKKLHLFVSSIVDKFVVQANVEQSNIDRDQLGAAIQKGLEQGLKVKMGVDSPYSDELEDVLDNVLSNPNKVKSNAQLRSSLTTLVKEVAKSSIATASDAKTKSLQARVIKGAEIGGDERDRFAYIPRKKVWVQYRAANDGSLVFKTTITNADGIAALNTLKKSGAGYDATLTATQDTDGTTFRVERF